VTIPSFRQAPLPEIVGISHSTGDELDRFFASGRIDPGSRSVPLTPPLSPQGRGRMPPLHELSLQLRSLNSGYPCEINFLLVYASSPSMPPSWP
jgi:hypothetical protein